MAPVRFRRALIALARNGANARKRQGARWRAPCRRPVAAPLNPLRGSDHAGQNGNGTLSTSSHITVVLDEYGVVEPIREPELIAGQSPTNTTPAT